MWEVAEAERGEWLMNNFKSLPAPQAGGLCAAWQPGGGIAAVEAGLPANPCEVRITGSNFGKIGWWRWISVEELASGRSGVVQLSDEIDAVPEGAESNSLGAGKSVWQLKQAFFVYKPERQLLGSMTSRKSRSVLFHSGEPRKKYRNDDRVPDLCWSFTFRWSLWLCLQPNHEQWTDIQYTPMYCLDSLLLSVSAYSGCLQLFP